MTSLLRVIVVGETVYERMKEELSDSELMAAAAQYESLQSQGFKLEMKKGDLFSCEETDSMAHCISQDCRMGKGIAVLFKKKFGGVQELIKQGQSTGGLAVLRRGDRYIYYLITKEKYWHKPTYDSLRSSLTRMREHCVKHNVTDIAMPKIGCGLDKLEWKPVTDIIKSVFAETRIQITVYEL